MKDECVYRLEDVRCRLGGRVVLSLGQLEVRRGEVLCLVGPTGAGKSTLLRFLAGLENAASGRAALWDQPLGLRPLPLDVQRRVTLVFQRPLLLSGRVRANVAYGLRLRGEPGRRERVEALLARLELASLARRSAQTLSGGEAQLVALARALVLGPEVLLLDEPTAHLDPGRVALVEKVLGELRREGPTTLVWATHNLAQARRVANRVALLLDGSLVEVAEAGAFFAAPRDPRTAAFLRGEMVVP